ncbi:exodeoxyribonuclease III [Aurantivibrio infirmus]
MKIVSFNVNSIRSRLHQLEAVIKKYSPDVIGIQETKVTDQDFPLETINNYGYHAEYAGQKTHYGVAMLTKQKMTNVVKGFVDDDENAQKRFIAGQITTGLGEPLTIANGYFPQGESRDHPLKFPNKKNFYKNLVKHLNANHTPQENIIVMGDMNISPDDKDIGIGEDNRKRWLKSGKASFLPEEREWLADLMNWGLEDSYRKIYPDADDEFSWFDYRSRGFERDPKRGLRIDFIYATSPLANKCIDAGIDYEIRAMEKPSDHCPVWSEFKNI